MARFYGSVQGSRGAASRLGGSAGLVTIAASWRGAIRTRLYVDSDGHDCVEIRETTWSGNGVERPIFNGRIGMKPKAKTKR